MALGAAEGKISEAGSPYGRPAPDRAIEPRAFAALVFSGVLDCA